MNILYAYKRIYIYIHTHNTFMGVSQYARCVNVLAASGYASGSASGMHQARIGCESGMHRGTHRVINPSVQLCR